MKGHHHESCPRRALQQGELVVNTSCVLWDSVSESTRPLGQVKKALGTFVNNDGNAQESDRDFAKKFTVSGVQPNPSLG